MNEQRPDLKGDTGLRTEPFISMLVTTYNRAGILADCLAKIAEQVANLPKELIEVIVSDNCSSDHTAEVVFDFAARYSFITLVSPPQHYPTAEENLFFGIPKCRGEYIWPIGDDDFLSIDAVESVVNIIKLNPCCFYLLNSAYIGQDGSIIASQTLPMTQLKMSLTMLELVQAVGFTTILASFTSTIARRRDLANVDLAALTAISPIYAHVAAYLMAFSDQQCLLVNEQWVTLRAGTSISAFETVAHATQNAMFEPWTVGLLRHVQNLTACSKIPRDLIFHCLESNGVSRFWTWANIIYGYTRQLELAARGERAVDDVTPAQFREFRSMMAGGNRTAFEVLIILSEIVDSIALLHQIRSGNLTIKKGPDCSDLKLRVRGVQQQNILQVIRLGIVDQIQTARNLLRSKEHLVDIQSLTAETIIGRYTIYRLAFWYVAVDEKAHNKADFDPRIIDVRSRYPDWVLARTLTELKSMLMSNDQVPSPVNGIHEGSEPAARGGMEHVIEGILDEPWYRSDHSDIVGSAFDHYMHKGLPSGDMPNAFFDEDWYRRASGVNLQTTRAVVEHYATVGYRQQLPPSAIFDERWYLTTYSDVRLLIRKGKFFSGLHHYVKVGKLEEFDPNPVFRTSWYARQYPASQKAFESGEIGSVFEHFLKFGLAMGNQPHPTYSEIQYLGCNPDVADAVAAGLAPSGWLHYLRHGREEGRALRA